MTSSQALILNLVGPLLSDLSWAAQTFRRALNIPIRNLRDLSIEVAPRRPSEFLSDSTRIDVTADAELDEQTMIKLVFEVKLADRYVSRVLDFGQAYERLVDESGLWVSDVLKRVDRQLNQMFRVHSLGASLHRASRGGDEVVLVLVHHDIDTRAEGVLDRYKSLLAYPEMARSLLLSNLIHSMRASAPDRGSRGVCDELMLRYVALAESDDVWCEFEAHRINSSR